MKNKQVVKTLQIPVSSKKSAHVLEWLVAAIKEERYKVGDRLPPERAIAERLNVSRTAVREALSSLQALGLIEPKVGDGNYVVGSIEEEIDADDALNALWESESLGEIWRIRRDLEIVLAKLAVEKATAGDLANIKGCLQKIREAVDKTDPDEYLTANIDFHLAVAEAGKNPFLKRALLPLLEITAHQLAKEATAEYISAHATDLKQKHRDIFNAVKRKDCAATAKATQTHFAASEEVFLKDSQNVRSHD